MHFSCFPKRSNNLLPTQGIEGEFWPTYVLTTSRLRRTPPKNYPVIFKRRVATLIDTIIPPFSGNRRCVLADALTQVRVFTDARLAVEVALSHPGGIAALNPRLLLSLRFPVLRTIGGGGGSKMP